MWEIHWLTASHMPPARDLAYNPDMCPDWESNQRPLALQDSAKPTESHWPRLLQLFKIIYLFIFTERGEGREKERERNINVRKIDWLPFSWHQPGTWPATQTCALTENCTSDLSVHKMMPNWLSCTSQGCFYFLIGHLIEHFHIYMRNTVTCFLFLILTEQSKKKGSSTTD